MRSRFHIVCMLTLALAMYTVSLGTDVINNDANIVRAADEQSKAVLTYTIDVENPNVATVTFDVLDAGECITGVPDSPIEVVDGDVFTIVHTPDWILNLDKSYDKPGMVFT